MVMMYQLIELVETAVKPVLLNGFGVADLDQPDVLQSF